MVGKFRITNELLCDLLSLPIGTEIIGAEMAELAGYPRDVFLVVKHGDIKSADGTVSEVMPRWRRQQPVFFEGWGQ